MVDVATLGLAVTSGPVEKGSAALKDLSGAAKRAEVAVDGFNASAGHTPVRMNASTDAMRKNTAALHAQVAASRTASHITRNLSFQLVDIGQALATAPTMGIYALQNLGFQVAQIGQLYAGQGGFSQAIKDSTAQVGRFITRMGPLAAIAGAVTIGFVGLQHEINKTSDVAVSFGDVFWGVIQTIGDGIWTIVKPAIDALAPWFATAWGWITSITKTGINGLIGGFVGGFNAIKATWSLLPAAIGDVAISAAQKAIDAVTTMLRDAAANINAFIHKINANLGTSIGDLGSPNKLFSRLELNNPYAGAASNAASTASNAFMSGQGDYAGQFFEAIKNNSIQNAIDRTKEKATEATQAMSQMARQALGGLTQLADWTNQQVAAARERIGQAADYITDRFGDFFNGLEQGKSAWESFRDVGLGVIKDLGRALLRSSILKLLMGAFGGGQSALYSGISMGFADGGYTGPGSKHQPAGVVHAGEYVFSAASVNRIGLGNLDRLHRGYAEGGYVSRAPMMSASNNNGPMVQIIDQRSGGSIERENFTGPNGEAGVRMIIRDELGKYDAGSYGRHVQNHIKARQSRAIR